MNHFSARQSSQQCQSVAKIREQADAATFFNVLTDDFMFEKLESLLPEHRERIYTPTDTLSMFLSQVLNSDRSCQHAVNEWCVARHDFGQSSLSTNTGGYCRARQWLPTELVSELTRYCGDELHKLIPTKWSWKGRHDVVDA